MVTSSKAKSSTKKAAKKKPGSNDAVRNFVEIQPIPDGMEEVVKSIVSGCFGRPVEIKRVSADPLSDIVATSLG